MPKDLILPTQTEQLEARIALLEQQIQELEREVYTARRDRDINYKRWWDMVEMFDPESNTLENMIEEIFRLNPEIKPEIKYTISKELRV